MPDRPRVLAFGMLAVALAAQDAPRQGERPLGDLSLEELGNVDITSVLKRPSPLSQSAAAIFVITREDIRRSGATTLPEVLRLAPNLRVAQVDAAQYTIGARGFNSSNVNKLLVLLDGRTIYSALHAGVFWDAQEVFLEDIERIEVISGPGGTLWGSNAVNGVINILTRSAKDTGSSLVAATVGTTVRWGAEARHGGDLGALGAFRVYAKAMDLAGTVSSRGGVNADAWHRAQGGFRLDRPTEAGTFTLQGDAYRGRFHQTAADPRQVEGYNLLGRWVRGLSSGSELRVQAYLDHTHRDQPPLFQESVTTLDLDLAHRFPLGARHEVVWGGGYRTSQDAITNSALLSFLPARKELRWANVFAQDTLALVPERLALTLGAKFERNVYTGWEFQPSGRLAWTVHPNHFLWAAVSRAVRTPARLDRDFYVNLPPILVLNGGPAFRSESVVAYEVGYRGRPSLWLSWSLSPFFNVYRDLRTFERTSQVLGNQLAGHTYGAELWGDVLVTGSWHLKPSYAYFRSSLRLRPGSADPTGPASAGNDARHRVQLTSYWEAGRRIEVDATLRHVSALPEPLVPAYWALHIRVGWRATPRLSCAIVGDNLLAPRHPEFGAPGQRATLEASGRVRVQWTF